MGDPSNELDVSARGDAMNVGEAPPGYRTQSEDTSYWAEKIQFDYWRSLEPWQKMRIVSQACAFLNDVTLAGLRLRHPNANHRELELRAAIQKYGREFLERFIDPSELPR